MGGVSVITEFDVFYSSKFIIWLDIDECAQFPCHNSALCTDGRNDYSCDCISPWKGKDCRFGKYCLILFNTPALPKL